MVTKKLGSAELLFRCAQQMGLRPVWVTPCGMFAITLAGRERYINLARSPLNSDASASLAKNKYLTRHILERHNMPNIPFVLPRTQAEAAVFLGEHGKIIAKPVTGSGAHDIRIITSREQFETIKITNYLLEKYIPGKELRYLSLNGRVVGVYRSDYGTSVEATRPLRCISYPRALWKPALIHSSLHIADILNLKFAAVDYLVTDSGRAYVLEVNTTPDLKWFHAPTTGPKVDVARLFLEAMLDNIGSGTQRAPGALAASPIVAYN